jgi:hypothetical protein
VQRTHPLVPEHHPRQPGPSARVILAADSAWDALLGTGLIVATVSATTRPLGAGPLRPWPLLVTLGVVCLAASAFLLHVSVLYAGDQARAVSVCRSVSPANMAATIAGVALLLAFPHPAHAYVVALAIASVGCAIFAVFEWTVPAPP